MLALYGASGGVLALKETAEAEVEEEEAVALDSEADDASTTAFSEC